MILAPFLTSLCSAALPGDDVTPHGRYVEARTASVYAGACHYGGEVVTDGREALLAWSFAAGSFRGVDLAGLTLAALVVDDANLALAGTSRRSVVYTPASADGLQRDALLGWARAQHGDLLGDVVVSLETAQRQARRGRRSLEDEVLRLLIHGTLHLLGHDHEDQAEARVMRAEERRLWREVNA